MIKKLPALLLLLFATLASAQPANADLTFQTQSPSNVRLQGCDQFVKTVVVQPNGKILLGGLFQYYNATPSPGIVRINPDGGRDLAFAGGSAMVAVNSIALQPDGKIVAVGSFNNYDFSHPANRIARLNSDGSFDATFAIGSGFNQEAFAVAIQPDAKVLVGGKFTTYNGTTCNRIARLNANGSLDPSFLTGSGANGTVTKIIVQPDGKIIVAGEFTSYNGTPASRLARLNADGTFDSTFAIGEGFWGPNHDVATIALQADGKILVGGMFDYFDVEESLPFIRLNSNGTKDTSFTFNALNLDVHASKILADGKILVSGNSELPSGDYEGHVYRLFADGSIDQSFSSEEKSPVLEFGVRADGKILMAGEMVDNNFGVNLTSANGAPELAFNTGKGFKQTVNKILMQPDGKVLAAGNFENYNGVVARRLVRLNANGSLDAAFNIGTGFDRYISTVALQTDGKILVGGYFTEYNGTSQRKLVRLNTDGSLDNSFNLGTGFEDIYYATVMAIAVQLDGKILVGGGFNSFNGQTAPAVIRLNADGSRDMSFNPAITNLVWTIALQPDGKILIGGSFNSVNSTTAHNIARLNNDGTTDVTFTSGEGFWLACESCASVRKIALQPDGKILAVGLFYKYNNSINWGFARLNADGTKDMTIPNDQLTGFDPGDNGHMDDVAVQSDGKILISGDFYNYGSYYDQNIVRLSSSGVKDVSFNGSTDLSVKSIIPKADGSMLIAGEFTLASGQTANRITTFDTTGVVDTSYNASLGFDNTVNDLVIQADGKIITAGTYTSYSGNFTGRLTRLNADATFDSTLNMPIGFNNAVKTLGLQTDGKIIVGGDFTVANGAAAARIVRLNTSGSADTSFTVGTGFNAVVNAVLILSDGKLMVGGNFTSYNGTAVNRIARLNSNGTIDATFNSGAGFNAAVKCLAMLTDGSIIAGGDFTTYNGFPAARLAKLGVNGTTDFSFGIGTGFNGSVESIVVLPNGTILAGGDFTSYNNGAANRLARISGSGALDTGFTIGTGFPAKVWKLAVQQNGKIVVGGDFTTFNGTAANKITRLNPDGTSDTTFDTAIGFNSTVTAIALQSDGKIVTGGTFTNYKDQTNNRIIRLLGDPVPLSVAEASRSQSIVVYPNPATNTINFAMPLGETAEQYEVYDLTGRCFARGNATNTIDIENLAVGIYILSVHHHGKTFTSKFLKE